MSRIETEADALAFVVQGDSDALDKVPWELRTREVCLAAVGKLGDNALEYSVPDALWNAPDFCREAVQLNGTALEYVPKEMQTPELCLTAVRQDGMALYSVPEEAKTPELCVEAVRQNGDALRLVPDNIKQEVELKLKQEA